MDPLQYRQDELYIEDVPLSAVAARFDTPAYVYSASSISAAFRDFDEAFRSHDHLICYSVKANSNLGVLGLLADLGSGFDIVSGGELQRVIQAGGNPEHVVFSGVGKQAWEIQAALNAGIACFNVESLSELQLIDRIAGKLDTIAPVSIRVNPDVDPGTHPYIATGLKENKFGVPAAEAIPLYMRLAEFSNLKVIGIDCHIGSQIMELQPFITALDFVLALVDDLEQRGVVLDHIDLGGGLGVRYNDEEPIEIGTYADAILQTLGHRKHKLVFEPGRYIVANAGVLLTSVITLKSNEETRFAVVDAAMNDLIRPALYQSWQNVAAVKLRHEDSITWQIVGPVCETGDFLARNRALALREGDLVAISSAGAYGFVMSSNYNTRVRAAEIMVSGHEMQCVRERENLDDLLRLEHRFCLP
ncbi:MAG: diaminopimelate decarboxylase [Pseudomonadales bacterium]